MASALGSPLSCVHSLSAQAGAARVDRLAGILRNGLLTPGSCQDGSVCSDLNLVLTGTDVPYDRMVFLHRFGPQSYIYTLDEPGRFVFFVDPAFQVLTPEAMGANWVVLCQDEVYVQDRIPPEHLIGVAVHRGDAESIRSELMTDLAALAFLCMTLMAMFFGSRCEQKADWARADRATDVACFACSAVPSGCMVLPACR